MSSVAAVQTIRECLVGMGYRPVPVRTGDKRPAGFAWTQVAREGRIGPVRAAELNTGILCDGLRPIDIDIDDAEIARKVRAVIVDRLGWAPEKWRSNSARRTLLYRASEGEPPKVSISGGHGKVEVLGHGQQFVAYGTHPTGAALEWGDRSLIEIELSQLTPVTEDQVAALLNELKPIIGVRDEKPTQKPTPSADMGIPISDGERSIDEIADLLNAIDPDCTYEDWYQALMAVHYETSGSASGLDLADAWSARGSKYKGRKEIEAKWRSFKGSGVTGGTLAALARQYGADLSAIAVRHMQRDELGSVEHGAEVARQLTQSADGTLHDAETGEIVEAEPVTKPGSIHFPPGLVGDLARWIVATSRRPQPVLALGAALCLVGVAAGRQIAGPTQGGTALYVLGLSATGSGKDHPLKQITRVMSAARMGHHIGPPEFISMTAVVRVLQRKPLALCPMDEFGDFMRRVYARKGSPHERAIPKILRTMWSANFDAAATPEWANVESVTINAPHLSLFGVSTHEQFYSALEGGATNDGTLNRFLIIEGERRVADQEPQLDPHTVPTSIINDMQLVFMRSGEMSAAMRNDLAANPADAGNLINLGWCADGAFDAWRAFRSKCETQMAERPETADFWVRGSEMAVRIATIIAAGRMNDDVRRDDVEFAIALVEQSIETMITGAQDYMAETDNEANIQKITRLLKERGMMKRRDLMRSMREMRARDLNDALNFMIEAEIVEKLEIKPDGSQGGRPTYAYRLM